jgi:hypothetical protein
MAHLCDSVIRPWSNITAEYWRIWHNIHILLQNDRQHNITAILEQASNIIAISETYYNNIYYWSTTRHHKASMHRHQAAALKQAAANLAQGFLEAILEAFNWADKAMVRGK